MDGSIDPLSCETDGDCTVTCLNDGECCDQLCSCTNVYATAFVERMQAQHSRMCTDAVCPVASCMAPTQMTVARCVDNQCIGEQRAIPAPAAPGELQVEPTPIPE